MNKQIILLVIVLAVHVEDVVHAGTMHNNVTVSSVKELRQMMTKSHQHIVMAPGTYVVSDLLDSRTVFHLSGSDNVYDLSGVTIQIPLSTLRKMTSRGAHGRAAYRITGDKITLKGGTFENTYDDGTIKVTDFGSYNQNSIRRRSRS